MKAAGSYNIIQPITAQRGYSFTYNYQALQPKACRPGRSALFNYQKEIMEQSFDPKPRPIDILTAQTTVLVCAVEALIATHPESGEVRKIFDQLFGQIQAGVLARGATPLDTGLMRQIAEHLFAPPSTDLS